jgi:hypothetical protein
MKDAAGLIASVAYVVAVGVLFQSGHILMVVMLTLPWSLFPVFLLIVRGAALLPLSDTAVLSTAVACAVLNVWFVCFCVRMGRKNSVGL